MNKKNVIIGFVTLMFLSCGHGKNSTSTTENSLDSTILPKILIDSNNAHDSIDVLTDDHTVNQDTVEPYRTVDSLVKLINNNFNKSALKQLDSICKTSDGDLGENFYEVCTAMLDHHLINFIDYLSQYPNSCLRESLLYGLAANASSYDKSDRIKLLNSELEAKIKEANSVGASNTEIQFLKDLYKEVDPSLFD